jgi:pimeloyl-ACP methyl ester carboxylesterase
MKKRTPYKKLSVNNIEINYIEYGNDQNEPILFLHGYADSALMFNKLARSLSHKYHVFAIDFPMAHDPRTIQSITTLTHFVKIFVEFLKLTKFSLVGFSLGGVVASNFVIKYPDRVKKVYLLNSTPSLLIDKFQRRLFRLVKPLIFSRSFVYLYSRLNTNKLVRRTFKSPPISSSVKIRMKANYYSIFMTVIGILDVDVSQEFNKVGVDKTIVLFRDDTIVPWDKYRKFVETLNAKVIVFKLGWHAIKKVYWENLKGIWLKEYQKDFSVILIEK